MDVTQKRTFSNYPSSVLDNDQMKNSYYGIIWKINIGKIKNVFIKILSLTVGSKDLKPV